MNSIKQDSFEENINPDIQNYINLFNKNNENDIIYLSTTNAFNIKQVNKNTKTLINLSKVNNIRYINRFFITVNKKLELDSTYIGCVETFTQRRGRKKIYKIPILNSFYLIFEFIFLRVFPKVWGLKKIYFTITRGRNRLLSKAETLGRLVSCGFEIIDHKAINGLLYFVVKKSHEPSTQTASYGPLYKMPRMGKNGKIIGVYKFRTMHPYAEFLHDYILKINGYSDTGKPADDFRLTPWGKILRKYWFDEVPQLINLFKGELKLVGVRPISQRYFQDIPKDLQEMRIKYKPGCIPPYVAFDRLSNVESVLDAEREYLVMKEKHPLTTDFICFFKAIFNIIFKNKRSA